MQVGESGVAVDELVSAIKIAIRAANISRLNASRDLKVVSIELKLNAIATVALGGGLDLRIPFVGMKIGIGSSITRADTHTVMMTLVSPDSFGEHEIRDQSIETALVEAVQTIRSVMISAADGDDPFVLKAGTVDLSFAVARDGSIKLGLNGELTEEITHTLRIEMERPEPESTVTMPA
jgi:hypothetical protein